VTETLQRLKTALADRYAIERELGQGGMATVYLAEDLRPHRKFALKVLRPKLVRPRRACLHHAGDQPVPRYHRGDVLRRSGAAALSRALRRTPGDRSHRVTGAAGELPPHVLGLVAEWAALHKAELEEDWRRAGAREVLRPIPPLE